jgi:hypothetical protein
VENQSRCPVVADCECKIEWHVSNYSPSRIGLREAVVKGHVLQHFFNKTYKPKRQQDGSYLALGWGEFAQKKSIPLEAGATEELYHGYSVETSAYNNPGAGFHESMSGDCSCTVRR